MSKVTARDIKRKTPEEITALARGVLTRTDFMATDANTIRSAFYMIMTFVDMTEAARKKVGALVGDMRQTVPGRAMNGYPIFLSVRFVHAADMPLVHAEIDRMRIALGMVCPTPCDEGCKARCHEEHQVPEKQAHDPYGCPGKD